MLNLLPLTSVSISGMILSSVLMTSVCFSPGVKKTFPEPFKCILLNAETSLSSVIIFPDPWADFPAEIVEELAHVIRSISVLAI